MRRPISWLVLPLLLLGSSLAAIEQGTQDLSTVNRQIGKEPTYQERPGYLLLIMGPHAEHKVWLVLDGNTLFVDRDGTGNLDQPECRVEGEPDRNGDYLFDAGNLHVGGTVYRGLLVAVRSAKRSVGSGVEEMPMFKEFLSTQPEGKLLTVSVDVPSEGAIRDLRDGSPIEGIRHVAGEYDSGGILQFAGRPEDAPIVHFGGPWTFGPDGQQKLVRGRNEDLALKLGTPGRGPGTFACIAYDNLIPDSARPNLRIAYPSEGDHRLEERYALEDRC